METTENKYTVPALEKSLVIIETMIAAGHKLGISELSTMVHYPKSSVFNILSTLEDFGYIEKTEDGKYTLTIKMYLQGQRILNQNDIRVISKPYMNELAMELGFTVHLAALVNGKAVYIEKVQGPAFVQFSTQIGQTWHLHDSGVGKAIAAYLPEATLDAIIKKHGMHASTPNSITTADEFKDFLQTVRTEGYALEDEEGEVGIRCIAAPIFDREGRVLAAISITAVRMDLPSHRFADVGRKVSEKAKLICQKLGYVEEQILT